MTTKGIVPTASTAVATTVPPGEAFRAWLATARGAYSRHTVAGWEADLESFEAWSAAAVLPVGASLPDAVAAYLRAQDAEGFAVGTLRRRIATIARIAKAAGIANPCDTEAVRLTMREIARTRGTGQKQAAGLNGTDAYRIMGRTESADATMRDLRDLALVLVGRDLLARASELVSVTVEAVSWDEEDGTATINLRRFKTDTEAHPCHLGQEAAGALRRWLAVSGLTAGPVFVALTKAGTVRRGADGQARAISPRDVSRCLKHLAGEQYSAHSLRVGMAQDMMAAGIDGAAIQQAAGWKSPTMLVRYTRKLNSKRGAVAQYHEKRKFR